MNHDHHGHHHMVSPETTVATSAESTNGVHDGHNEHSSYNDVHSMKMSFHFDEQIELLFKTLSLDSQKHIVSACIVLAIVAIINEAIKLGRAKLQQKMKPKQFLNLTCSQKIFNGWHCLQTLFHLIQLTISYALMLSFMTFQVWICISILIGSTIGYFLFGWAHSSVDSNCG